MALSSETPQPLVQGTVDMDPWASDVCLLSPVKTDEGIGSFPDGSESREIHPSCGIRVVGRMLTRERGLRDTHHIERGVESLEELEPRSEGLVTRCD